MDDIVNAKVDVETVERIIKLTDELPLPEELQHLNGNEIQKLDKSLVKRLDCTLMPVVVLLFLLNILDRNNIANAKIAGLTKTLGITNAQYNTCLMIFYVGCEYLVCQLEIAQDGLLIFECRCNHTVTLESHYSESAAVNLYLWNHFCMGCCIYVTSFHPQLCRIVCLEVHSRFGRRSVIPHLNLCMEHRVIVS